VVRLVVVLVTEVEAEFEEESCREAVELNGCDWFDYVMLFDNVGIEKWIFCFFIFYIYFL